MKRTLSAVALSLSMVVTAVAPAVAGTAVPGHQDRTSGVVMGAYDSVYAYDQAGDWYWDLGDGRVWGTVASVDELEQDSITVCDYRVVYQGDFGDDPFLDTGWIRNNVRCSGVDRGNFNYLIIHENDHRYTGERRAVWGTWEFFVDAVGGVGNVANPHHHVND